MRRQTLKGAVGLPLQCSSFQSPTVTSQRRWVGADIYKSGLLKRSPRDAVSLVVRDSNIENNKQLYDSLNQMISTEKVEFRRRPCPWEIVPRYSKRRVSDLVGILKSEHRMEIEQIIEDMQSIADVECYVVIVPTVGYVSPQTFAHSIMWNWAIGEPRGNGLLLLIAQQEGAVQLVASQGIMEFFHQRFLELVVQDIFQPLCKQGDASYAILQTVYAIARQAHEFRDMWNNRLVPLPVLNKARFGARVLQWGMFRTWYFWGSIFFTGLTAILLNQLLDALCPECGHFMARVLKPEKIFLELDAGLQIEYENACADFRVWRCQNCHKGKRVVQISRDFHFNDKCLKCGDCGYHTVTLKSTIEKLPSKDEDGRKRQVYTCQHCRVGRDIVLPLFRPLDSEPVGEWYDFLLKGAKDPGHSETLKPEFKVTL